LDLSVQLTLSAMPVFKQFCGKESCKGLERHFEGKCHRVESVITRRVQARQEREEQHAAFLVRQARRDEIADRLAKRHADQKSEVSTNADELSLVDGNCGEDWTVPVSNFAGTVLPEKASKEDDDDWNVPHPLQNLSIAAEKELRRLDKKLRDIAKIEDAMAAGKGVDKLQLHKVATKDDLLVLVRKTKAGEIVHAGQSKKSEQLPQKTVSSQIQVEVHARKSAKSEELPKKTDQSQFTTVVSSKKAERWEMAQPKADKTAQSKVVTTSKKVVAEQPKADRTAQSKVVTTSKKVVADLWYAKTTSTVRANATKARGANGLRASVGELALPTAGCRVHFSGALMFDQQISGWCSLPYLEDQYSEYVGKGKYASNMRAFPKAIGATFDSVAVDAGTRVTIYSEQNFKGKVLWDRVGPAIVVNTLYKDSVFHKGRPYSKLLKEEWEGELQVLFPPAVREFSINNMHTWNSGSLVIQDGQSFPQSLDDITEYHALPNPRY